jgi:PhnB protein
MRCRYSEPELFNAKACAPVGNLLFGRSFSAAIRLFFAPLREIFFVRCPIPRDPFVDSKETTLVLQPTTQYRRIKMTTKVNPIPAGSHTVTPHLCVKGAGQAIEFYKKAFNAEELCRIPSPDGSMLIHSAVKIGDSILFIYDEVPQMGALGPKSLGGSPVRIHLYVEDVDSLYNQAVKAGAEVGMPLADQPWGDRYGTLTDPFGHSWGLATHVEDVSFEEMNRRFEAACVGH